MNTLSEPFGGFYRGKRVFLTGHTGFKGGWLAEWLLALGAEVTGLSLPPPTDPALFDQLALAERLDHRIGDVRDLVTVRQVVEEVRPDFVFHLAAQPLVVLSYTQPVETYASNVMGTIHVLEALRGLDKPCAAVFITSDKCYENREWVHGYREEDPLGGDNPYSASKAAAEIAIASYRRSFFQKHPVRIASARAGNVIGGGDWALDRLMPDCMRALRAGQAIPVRNKTATRPWQHVLEPLSGYLSLGAKLTNAESAVSNPQSAIDSAFNFGPSHDGNRTVVELVQEVLKHWPGRWEDRTNPNAVQEAVLLQLAADKARALLGWSPVWNFIEAVQETVVWYRQACQDTSVDFVRDLTLRQIHQYSAEARSLGLAWATPR